MCLETDKQYWIVVCQLNPYPKGITWNTHPTFERALEEASRLAKINKDNKFLVARVSATVEVATNPVQVTYLKK